MKNLVLLFALIFSSASHASNPIIDLTRVNPVTKKKLVKMGFNKYTQYDQIEKSIEGNEFVKENYHYNYMSFEVEKDMFHVWEAYTTTDPRKAWNGGAIELDFLYSRRDQKTYYHDDEEFPEPHVGAGLFVLLNVYGLGKISAGMEITKIDETARTLEFTYLLKNASNGRQIIQMSDLGNNRTKIEHITYFNAGKKWRDKMYPTIHESLLGQLHQNIMSTIRAPIQRID